MKKYAPCTDVSTILNTKYRPYLSAHLQYKKDHSIRMKQGKLRKKNPDAVIVPHWYEHYYDGYLTQSVYKDGYPCIYVIYCSRKRWDASLTKWYRAQDNGRQRDYIRREKIGKQKACKAFIREAKRMMITAGYIEHEDYDDAGGTRILYYQLPTRFYTYMARLKDTGLKELEVLARMDKNKNGLLGTFLVHKVIEDRKGVTRYNLISMEFGSIPRDNRQAMSLRELLFYGYYPIGRSTYDHLKLLTSYWNDYDRKLYLPPEEGFILYNRCTYRIYCARKKRKAMQRKKEKKM